MIYRADWSYLYSNFAVSVEDRDGNEKMLHDEDITERLNELERELAHTEAILEDALIDLRKCRVGKDLEMNIIRELVTRMKEAL
jgi:hypothetical protein